MYTNTCSLTDTKRGSRQAVFEGYGTLLEKKSTLLEC